MFCLHIKWKQIVLEKPLTYKKDRGMDLPTGLGKILHACWIDLSKRLPGYNRLYSPGCIYDKHIYTIAKIMGANIKSAYNGFNRQKND